MRKLREERIEAIALAVIAAIKETPGLKITDPGEAARRAAARLLSELGTDPELDRSVRARIASLSRDVPEGGREWEILYRQYSEELSRRR